MAKIITIPNNKKIKALNEGFFDDDTTILNDVDNTPEVGLDILGKVDKDLYDAKIHEWLEQLEVLNYEIIYTGHNIYVDVKDHLILSNRRLTSIPYFHFRNVQGNCNFANNKFVNWHYFPTAIGGDLIANFNYIRDFDGVPSVGGKVYADRLRIRTIYKLTLDNYNKARKGIKILENTVYIPKIDKYGTLTNINENMCTVLHDDNTIGIYATHEVNVLNGLDYLEELK